MTRKRQAIQDKYPDNAACRIVAIGFRATAHESETIEALAAARGLTAGAYCRLKALDGKLPTEVPPKIPVTDKAAILELKHIGNNLNQAVAALHAQNKKGEVIPPSSLTEIIETARLIRRALFALIPDFVSKEERRRNQDIVITTVGAATGFTGKPPTFDDQDNDEALSSDEPKPTVAEKTPDPPVTLPGRRRL